MASTVSGKAPSKRESAAATHSEPGIWSWLKSLLNSPLADYHLIAAATLILLGFGITMVTSSSSVMAYISNGDAWYFAKRQLVFAVVGVVAAWWISRRGLGTLRALGAAGIVVSVLLLVATVFLGTEVNGNKSWLMLPGGIGIQASEFAKLAIIVWGGDVLAKRERTLDQPARLLFPFTVFSGIAIALVLLEHDMGTSIVMAMIVLAILFVVGLPMRIFAGLGVVGAAAAALLVLTSPNRMARILGFLTPGSDTTGINQQSTQSLWGIAAGGWFGRGLSHSRQKYGYLPEAHTDFIFAILSEELGLFGSLTVVAMFSILCFAGLRTALRSDTLFCRIAAAGCTTWLLFQAILNLFVVLQLLPVTGVPLPFLSYGGSSLLANLMAVGVLLACARNEPDARHLLALRPGGVAPRLMSIVDGGRR